MIESHRNPKLWEGDGIPLDHGVAALLRLVEGRRRRIAVREPSNRIQSQKSIIGMFF